VVLGVQRVECQEDYLDYVPPGDLPAALAQGTEFEAPIFVYRSQVSAANVIGVLHPYKGTIDAVSNYGLSGGSANLGTGPTLEDKVLKIFFYEGSNGLTYYNILGDPSSVNEARIVVTEKSNSIATSVLLSNNEGEFIGVDSPSAKKLLDLPLDSNLYDGLFEYSNRTAGGILGYFDDLTEVRTWEVILDPLQTGNIVMIKGADGKDDSEIVLAQGPVDVNFDFSTLRRPLGEETEEESDVNSAWGNLLSVSTGEIAPGGSGEDTWWYRFVGDPGGPAGANPYSLFDGTYGNRAPDIGTGLLFGVVSNVAQQNIRLWRDYEEGEIGFVSAVDNVNGGWTEPYQRPAIRIYSVNENARDQFTDTTKPLTITDLRVLCSCYQVPATTFSITIIDVDGNVFEFPDRTVIKRSDDYNALTWISFGAPASNEVVVIESDPSILESPPTGTIVGTGATGRFKKELDLRKIKRVIVDLKRVEGDGQYVLGIHTIAGMVSGMGRWPSTSRKAIDEPQAYAIIEAFAVYWRYEEPSDGWPEIPTNVIGNYLLQWWPPQALKDTWSIIPGYEGESQTLRTTKSLYKNPLDEIKSNRIIFTPIPPTDGCQMFWKQVEWLERGHRIGAACSFYVVIDGMGFIVTKRSIGIDTTCGGGESADNPCVSNFVAAGEGHPAIAWPSLDGDEFIGQPTSGYVTFIKDTELSDRILMKLNAGEVTNINGDPVNNVPFILFPSI